MPKLARAETFQKTKKGSFLVSIFSYLTLYHSLILYFRVNYCKFCILFPTRLHPLTLLSIRLAQTGKVRGSSLTT